MHKLSTPPPPFVPLKTTVPATHPRSQLLKIEDNPAIPRPLSKKARPSAVTGTSIATPARPVSDDGKFSGDLLWPLLGAFAATDTAPDGVPMQGAASTRPVSGKRGGAGKLRSFAAGVAAFSEGGGRAVEVASAGAGAEATVRPLVVSVVATLRTGSGSYLNSKAVLEVSKRKRNR